jgi:hypothetical protein
LVIVFVWSCGFFRFSFLLFQYICMLFSRKVPNKSLSL